MTAKAPRRSSGFGTRSTRPEATRRCTMFVALVGWTMSRSPMRDIDSRPSRLKASSTSAS